MLPPLVMVVLLLLNLAVIAGTARLSWITAQRYKTPWAPLIPFVALGMLGGLLLWISTFLR